ncbi:hypothetical protein HI914_04765 [Erysiphe necator]|nr:hypothetical protein HI914_04765 [Erysiphe necator]
MLRFISGEKTIAMCAALYYIALFHGFRLLKEKLPIIQEMRSLNRTVLDWNPKMNFQMIRTYQYFTYDIVLSFAAQTSSTDHTRYRE